ncbi:MAG: sulfatase-like hydrolase/transferase [bacterium]
MVEQNKRPNIIFFFSDQQRWDTVGAYGQTLDVTPNLDKMAEEGIKFEYAFSCQPVCGPARACLQTGKYATEIGTYRNGIALPLDERTIAHHLADTGYEVAYVGKWHLASSGEDADYRTKPIPPLRRGGYRDYWMAADILEFTSHGYDGYVYDGDMNKVDFEGYRTDRITDFALDFIEKDHGDKPFYLMLSHIEPHHQNDRDRYEGPNGSKEKFKDYQVPGDLEGTEGDWEENYPDYLGCCNSLDNNLGRIRKRLEELGIADNTIIIYTSDHGSHFRTRNGEYKRSCHEASIRIPLVIYGPGFRGGKEEKRLASLLDVPSTILTAAGIEPPDYMQGFPLQELVNNNGDWREEVFLQISESQVGRAIRTKRWKYSVRAPHKDGWNDSESDIYVEDFLYDLENDPFEKNNLVKEPAYAEIREEMAERLKRNMMKANEKKPMIKPAGSNIK